eukprot:12390184-Karenia_brevis.AAC.1
MTKDKGRYVNFLQLCNHFGGAKYPQARKEALAYAKNCLKLKGKFATIHGWTNVVNFLLMERLVESTSLEEWHTVSDSYATENVWEGEAQ